MLTKPFDQITADDIRDLYARGAYENRFLNSSVNCIGLNGVTNRSHNRLVRGVGVHGNHGVLVETFESLTRHHQVTATTL